MSLCTLNDVLIPARKAGYAVGAFEFWSLDSAQAIVEAASQLQMPVILQASIIECDFAGGMKYLSHIAQIVAENASISVVLHYDHGKTYENTVKAIEAGFSSVMIDASDLSFQENIRLTKKVVKQAQKAGVTVEAELGSLAGSEGAQKEANKMSLQTGPEQARIFVEETNVDALAVAIGTAHGLYDFEPEINIKRLQEIEKNVDIPLVLHGGSGTPDKKVVEAIKHGIAKVNVCTEFVQAFGHSYIDVQHKSDFRYSPPLLFGPAKEAGRKLVAKKIKLFTGDIKL